MKKSIPIVLGILWLLVVAGIAFRDGAGWNRQEKMHLCQDGIQAEGKVYVLDNREGEGVIYEIDDNHTVTNLFFTGSYRQEMRIAGLAWHNGLYALLQEPEGEYCILKLDETMHPAAASDTFLPKESGSMTDFAVDETGFYLTLISDRQDTVYTYFMEKEENLKEISSEKEPDKENLADGEADETVFLRLLRLLEAEEGRRIIDAGFSEGEYLVRLDDGTGKEHFLLSETILDSFYQRELSPIQIFRFQQEKLVFYGLLLLTGYVLLILGTIVLRNRNHTVYTVIIVELVLLCVIAMGAGLAWKVRQDAEYEQNEKYGTYYLRELERQIGGRYKVFAEESDFYRNENYYEISEQIRSFLEEEGPAQLFYDIALVRASDHRVLAGASGRNTEHAAYRYSTAAIPMLDQMKDGIPRLSTQVWIEGSPYLLIGVSEKETLIPEYCFLGLLKSQPAAGMAESRESYLKSSLIIFLIASILCAGLIFYQERDIRSLGRSMFLLACGDYEIKKDVAYGKDIDLMWNSLLQIRRRMNKMNYTKFKLYESCYRFAPKRLEKILGKDSIEEVSSGDVARLYGTLAIINNVQSTGMDASLMQRMNTYIQLLDKHKDQKQGFFLSGSDNLDHMKMLFLQESKEATDFGVNFMRELQQTEGYERLRTGMLLHYDHYSYGVAGNNEQCFPFLVFDKMKAFEKLGRWLQQQQIKLTITDSVMEREGLSQGLRYIGYLIPEETKEEIRLYEVLYACEEEERRKKTALNQKFQKGLKLFYQSDFYLARSTFSEIMREYTEDRIAKWYLFTCEKYLNRTAEGEICFDLGQAVK